MIEQYGSSAFRQEYEVSIPQSALRKDIESYLGEYRFQIPTYNYQLELSADEKGEVALRDVDKKEPLKDMAEKAIQRRWSEGKSIIRETAELIGIKSYEEQLQKAPDNSTLIWMSPPGSPEDGYGTYGFVYIGKVSDEEQRRLISMKAIRVENPSSSQFNNAITEFTKQQVAFNNPEEFLSQPIITEEPIDNYEKILTSLFDFDPDPHQEAIFRNALKDLNPRINEFIELVKQGISKSELVKTFKSLENYALDLKAYYQSLHRNDNLVYLRKPNSDNIMTMRYVYSYEPPEITGSCGSTGETSNIFGKYNSLSKLFSSDEQGNFVCPKCNKPSKPPIGDSCPKCGYTKQQAQKNGKKVC